jgi:protein phosphatase
MIGFGLTDKGLVRKANEDSYLCCLRRQLFVVADGMGGHAAGEVASKLAIQTINTRLNYNLSNISGDLYQAVLEANTKIYEFSQEKTEYTGMGTTLTAMVIDHGKAFIAHVGDSRAYLIRDGKINLLTKDHSLVSELIRCGQLSIEDAENHPQKHMLTRALGTGPIVQVDFLEYAVYPDDYLVLCTDGLTNLVTEEMIKNVIINHDIKTGTVKLIDMALQQGGHDNITVIIVRI